MPSNKAVRTDEPLQLGPVEVQELYLDIQSKLGILIAATPDKKIHERLTTASTLILRAKRGWIGYIDELREKD